MLMAPVQSVQKTSKFFVSHEKNSGRTCGCKGSLLKVRERKYKREHGGHRWNLQAEKVCPFSRCF
jgi:hypothetical protein